MVFQGHKLFALLPSLYFTIKKKNNNEKKNHTHTQKNTHLFFHFPVFISDQKIESLSTDAIKESKSLV